MIEDNIIKSVYEIFSLDYVYNIAEYQRGYKWDRDEVQKLLEDIDSFKVDESNDKFYCLQHLTIKKNSFSQYDVIDGQQRLTTIIILLAYLEEISILKNDEGYKIKYSIREESKEDLKLILELANKKDFTFIDNNFREKSQDTYHFCLALDTIDNFFKNKEESYISSFRDKLLNHVKLIVNDLSSSNLNSEIIFRNLNINKVELTNCDFIRAIFVTYVNEDNDIEKKLKRIRVASFIDEMNMYWSREEVSKICSFDINKNIDLLYSLYYKTLSTEEKKEESLFKYLSNKSEEEVSRIFDDILLFHRTMMFWFEDRKIYHLLGFIFTHIKNIKDEKNANIDSIIYVYEKWKTSNTYDNFIKSLKDIIKENIKELYDENNKLNLDRSFYGYDNSLTIKILVLMDIINIINNLKMGFLDSQSFNINNEDIEHIFSKTPNNDSTVKEALYNINYILENTKDLDKDIKDRFQSLELELKNKEENLKLLDLNLLMHYKETIMSYKQINSIGNLVLLNQSINRSYKNIDFLYKRSTIIDSANKIRNHTLTIFTKSFIPNSNNNLDEWTFDDIEKATYHIKKTLEKFFN